jgi:hypothetical protein
MEHNIRVNNVKINSGVIRATPEQYVRLKHTHERCSVLLLFAEPCEFDDVSD